MKQFELPNIQKNTPSYPLDSHFRISQPLGSAAQSHTSVSGRSCVCTGLSHHPSHKVRSPGPPRLHHHQFHFCWPQPQNTTALPDTKGTERQALLTQNLLNNYTSLSCRELSGEVTLGFSSLGSSCSYFTGNLVQIHSKQPRMPLNALAQSVSFHHFPTVLQTQGGNPLPHNSPTPTLTQNRLQISSQNCL